MSDNVKAAERMPGAMGSLQPWLTAAGFLALYLALDWASYIDRLPHTSITAWNPNTGVAVALLLARGPVWAPFVAFSIFAGELLIDVEPPPTQVLAMTSAYVALVYAAAAWFLRRGALERPIATPKGAAWFVGVTGIATGLAALGYVAILERAGEVPAAQMQPSVAHFWIGEFSGVISLTPVLLLRIDWRGLPAKIRGQGRELVLQIVAAMLGVGLALSLAAALGSGALFYPLFVPVTWIALRKGVAGAMVSVSLAQAALVAAIELTHDSLPLFEVQIPLLALGMTALFLGAVASQRDAVVRQMRDQDAVLQRSLRFAVAGQLASALTHELNQPITALVSYVRAAELLDNAHTTADPRLSDTLHKAADEALRAAAVLRRLREFYRGEGAHVEPTEPLSICARVADALRDRMRRMGVEFQLRAAGALPPVMVDRTQFEIVIQNLLTNSLDAFDPVAGGGRRAPRIEVSAEARGADVLITVDDSGPGIPPALDQRLFEPFLTSKIAGMGLGLALSRTLLRHQGGDLWVEPSRLGGARFVIRLPTHPSAQTQL